jgi:membrane protein DedA with SNARE-associated domain
MQTEPVFKAKRALAAGVNQMDQPLQKNRPSWLASTIWVFVLWVIAEGLLDWFVVSAPGTAIVLGLMALAVIALLIGAFFYMSGRDP